ncbi:MAG TPA: hypothetical protein VIV60_26880 [Polyangiaceae bacterium]
MLSLMDFVGRWRLLGSVCISMVLTGACAETTSGAKHPVRARAPFDLHCDAQELSFDRLDEKTIGVSGCGKRATYIETCRDTIDSGASFIVKAPVTDTECQWVMNSSGRD